jgi:hypothetical protein
MMESLAVAFMGASIVFGLGMVSVVWVFWMLVSGVISCGITFVIVARHNMIIVSWNGFGIGNFLRGVSRLQNYTKKHH